MWDLIVSVPDHCLSFYFVNIMQQEHHFKHKHIYNDGIKHINISAKK